MKREKKTPTKVKSRKNLTSNSSSSSSDEQNEPRPSASHKKRENEPRMLIEESVSQANVTVRLENADMLTKYRHKNPHIKIIRPETTTHFASDEISDDDEIWTCDVPDSIDMTKLVGKSIKLGSKKSIIETDDGTIEYSSSKYESNDGIYQNTLSIVFQDNDSTLSIKNIKPVGRMSFYKKLNHSDEPIQLHPTGRHECTLFPANLVLRHPLLGRNYEDKVNVNETIKSKLSEAQTASTQSRIVIKQEKEGTNIQPSLKKRKKRKDESADNLISHKKPKEEIKTETEDDDLDRIKQIFGKNH